MSDDRQMQGFIYTTHRRHVSPLQMKLQILTILVVDFSAVEMIHVLSMNASAWLILSSPCMDGFGGAYCIVRELIAVSVGML